MRAAMIVKGEIATDRAARLADAIVGSQVDLLVFDASPQALDEHVVSPGASAVHADRDAMLQQHAGKVDAGELAALVAVGGSPASRLSRASSSASMQKSASIVIDRFLS